MNKCTIVVKDSKPSRRGKEYNLVFRPAKGCHNKEQAKEESAILAIMKLAPTIAHERRLPEPYKTTYLNATSALTTQKEVKTLANRASTEEGQLSTNKTEKSKAIASTNLASKSNFHSNVEKRDHQDKTMQQKNAAKHRQEALELANKHHSVSLSLGLRSKIQKLLAESTKSSDDNQSPKVEKAMCESKQQQLRRPKSKLSFWARPPKNTPHAISFPSIPTSLKQKRENLPAGKARFTFVEKCKMAEKSNRILLVTGDPGCGKSTQIPQFLL